MKKSKCFLRVAMLGIVTISCAARSTTQETDRENCLRLVYDEKEISESQLLFDRAFDTNVQGRSFSCDLVVSPTSARAALEDFRAGVIYGDSRAIARSVHFPLRVNIIDSTGARQGALSVSDLSEWDSFQTAHLRGQLLAMISCANARNVKIYRSRGFTIGQGAIWFTGSEGDLAVSTINLSPVTQREVVEFCIVDSSSE